VYTWFCQSLSLPQVAKFLNISAHCDLSLLKKMAPLSDESSRKEGAEGVPFAIVSTKSSAAAVDESTNQQWRFPEKPWRCVLYFACALVCALFLASLAPAAIGIIGIGSIVTAYCYALYVLLARMKEDFRGIHEDLSSHRAFLKESRNKRLKMRAGMTILSLRVSKLESDRATINKADQALIE
jgi:hypothetical protein